MRVNRGRGGGFSPLSHSAHRVLPSQPQTRVVLRVFSRRTAGLRAATKLAWRLRYRRAHRQIQVPCAHRPPALSPGHRAPPSRWPAATGSPSATSRAQPPALDPQAAGTGAPAKHAGRSSRPPCCSASGPRPRWPIQGWGPEYRRGDVLRAASARRQLLRAGCSSWAAAWRPE